MFELPTSLMIQDKELDIRNDGDYRIVLDCFSALQDEELGKRERIITSLIIFYDSLSLDNIFDVLDSEEYVEEAVKQMFNFFSCNRPDNNRHSPKLVDWEQDEQMIASAINATSHTEVRSVPYLHWWTFMGYYMSIGESVMSTVVNIRSKIVEGKKLEKHEQEFRRKNPEYFVWNRTTVEQREADAYVKSIWNSDKDTESES